MTSDTKKQLQCCEICEENKPSFRPKCYTKDDEIQVCKECHALFCCFCRLKSFQNKFLKGDKI